MSARVKVWDPLVRVFHWGLVLSFATAWLSAGHFKTLHMTAGYIAAALIVTRIVWGFVGGHYARFSQFVRSPRTILTYLGDIMRGSERRFLGHNPAGGAMIVALILSVGAQLATGWLQTTDAFFGVEWLEIVHGMLAKLSLGLVALHIGGVVLASLRHRENLPAAMVNGLKRAPAPGDIA